MPAAPKKTANEKARARRLYAKLDALYPDAKCALHFDSPFQLLVATILSAQCTDEAVNKATPALFAKYPTPAKMADAKVEDLEKLVKTCGFYRNKAKNIKAAAAGIMEDFDGEVPQTIEDLITLPGAARKTANVVLGNAFGINEGMVVDTHIGRLSVRLGFTQHDSKNAVKIEQDLMALFPRKTWTQLAHLFIAHGRAVCKAQRPACDTCPIKRSCPQKSL
ncbi:endonuclease III [Algisphaera agarilytica]|uniref:Endonuclease III n=1 Tax=Algisphaera agarilytica TaxID=1385975 RepID=A0A7X0LIY9_9BACT|nr:endonuclease III [Algisphaera agarilytica]MBB6428745.1 endonuclease-3 [Algisphaera agarilytica]